MVTDLTDTQRRVAHRACDVLYRHGMTDEADRVARAFTPVALERALRSARHAASPQVQRELHTAKRSAT